MKQEERGYVIIDDEKWWMSPASIIPFSDDETEKCELCNISKKMPDFVCLLSKPLPLITRLHYDEARLDVCRECFIKHRVLKKKPLETINET